MAILMSGTTHALSRVTGLVATTSDYSCMFWVKPVLGTGGVGRNLLENVDDVNVYNEWIGIFSDPGTMETWYLSIGDGGVQVASSATVTVSANTYAAVAYVRSGTANRFYLNGVLVGTATYDTSTVTIAEMYLGQGGTGTAGDQYQNFREWDTALTLAELLTEWNSPTPVKTANLKTNTSLATNYTDSTANANDWTAVGSTSFVPSAVPKDTTNSTALLAHAVNLTDVYVQVPFDTGSDTQDSWWSYTTNATEKEVGAWGFADPSSTLGAALEGFIYEGPASAPVRLLSIAGPNRPIQFPVTPSTTYYFLVFPYPGPLRPTASYTVSFKAAPTNTAPIGSLFVNDDTAGFPAAIMSSTTGQVLQFVHPIVAGEQGDVLNSGTILLEDVANYPQMRIYNNQLVQVGSPISFGSAGSLYIRSQPTQNVWYVGTARSGGLAAQATTVSEAGAFGGTTWTLAGVGMRALCGNSAGTILYYTTNAGDTIRRWDLSLNSAMADLVAGIANYIVTDILVLTDDTVIASYYKASATKDFLVKHYSAAGAVLNTYSIGGLSGASLPRMAYAIDNPNSFWTMHLLTTLIDQFYNIKVSDGSILHNLTNTVYEGGAYLPAATATPTSRFGQSQSCPFMVLRAALGGGGGGATTETLTMRRLRRAPHLSTEQLWNFYAMFQLDLETGVGLTSGQGSDPQIMLRYSDDGGHTWSNEIWVSAGALGQYARRAIWRRLGRSRDRVFEITYSEPTKFALVNAYLDVTGGTS